MIIYMDMTKITSALISLRGSMQKTSIKRSRLATQTGKNPRLIEISWSGDLTCPANFENVQRKEKNKLPVFWICYIYLFKGPLVSSGKKPKINELIQKPDNIGEECGKKKGLDRERGKENILVWLLAQAYKLEGVTIFQNLIASSCRGGRMVLKWCMEKELRIFGHGPFRGNLLLQHCTTESQSHASETFLINSRLSYKQYNIDLLDLSILELMKNNNP